jgi:SWI/SNF-related matrix-associated actin-dependent regulator of chromatin subfamily A3
VGCPFHRTDAGEAAKKAEADAFSLTRLYADCTSDCCFGGPAAGAAPQPAGLLAQLQGFQRATLAWALSREAQPQLLPLHPQVRALKTGSGQTLYWDDGGGALGGGASSKKEGRRFGLSSPVDPPLDFRGGIIADELGLGKTVEVLALILSTKGQAPQPPSPGSPGAASFVAKSSTYRLSADTLAQVDIDAAEKLGLRRSGRRGAGRIGRAAAAGAEEHTIYMSRGTLVVVPSPLLDQWRREIKQHVAPNGLRVCVLDTKQEAAAEDPCRLARFDLVLTTTEVVGATPQWADPTGPGPLLRVHWLRLVVDEAHQLRNLHSTTAVFCRAAFCQSRWAVTGTPITAQLNDLFGLLSYLQAEPFNAHAAWAHSILRPVTACQPHGRDALTSLLRRIAIRHEKSAVKLPPRTMETVAVALSGLEAAAYGRLMSRRRQAHFEGKLQVNHKGLLPRFINSLRLCANGIKHSFTVDGDADDDAAAAATDAAAQALKAGLLRQGCDPQLADKAASLARASGGLCASCGATIRSPVSVATTCGHAMCSSCADSALAAAVTAGGADAPCPQCRLPYSDSTLTVLTLGAAASAAADDEDDDAAAGGSKVAWLLSALKKLPDGARSLVFSAHSRQLTRVARGLEDAGISHARFDCSHGVALREAALSDFRSDASIKVLLLDTRLAACGLTLTEAQHVYVLDVPSTAGQLEQAASRAWRIGQTKPVRVTLLVAADTIEARLWMRLQRSAASLAGNGSGGLRSKDAFALKRKAMLWLISNEPLKVDDSDDEEGDGGGAAGPAGPAHDVQAAPERVEAAVRAGMAAAAESDDDLPPGFSLPVKREAPSARAEAAAGPEVISLLDDTSEEEEDAHPLHGMPGPHGLLGRRRGSKKPRYR